MRRKRNDFLFLLANFEAFLFVALKTRHLIKIVHVAFYGRMSSAAIIICQ
jgi:hypothetical protein